MSDGLARLMLLMRDHPPHQHRLKSGPMIFAKGLAIAYTLGTFAAIISLLLLTKITKM